MTKVTVEDVLRHAGRFEEMLSDYYRSISDSTTREGVRLITDYMSRHRRRINGALNDMDASQKKRIKNVILSRDPEAADTHCFLGLEVTPESSANEVLDAAIRLDGCLIQLYSEALEETNDPIAREFLESLVQSEERDSVGLKKMKAMNYF